MSEAALHIAMYDRLQGWGPLITLLADGADSVNDQGGVPQSTTPESNDVFPYVTLGPDVHADWDTDDIRGLESSLFVNSYSRSRGRLETEEIQEQIRAALESAPLIVGASPAVLLHFVSSTVTLEPDGKTQMGVTEFRSLVRRAE